MYLQMNMGSVHVSHSRRVWFVEPVKTRNDLAMTENEALATAKQED
jgi:hypothetical protein